MKGDKIIVLSDGFKKAGKYSVSLSTFVKNKGIYIAVLKTGNASVVKKCIVIK